jgi:DNA-binding NtrC family response regulator
MLKFKLVSYPAGQNPEDSAVSDRSRAKSNEHKPAKTKILLADDDLAIRQSLNHLLTEENYLVQMAANGDEALKLAAATKFDLALLDLRMPIKDGWETLKQLSTENPMLPIILMTARPNQVFSAMASGVGALFEKPLDLEKMFQTMKMLLDEPAEARLARYTKRSSMFCYAAPKSAT